MQKYEKKDLFIGIDFSKSKFDVSLLERTDLKDVVQSTFDNTATGYKEFLRWVSKQSTIKRESWLFCGEQTGLYSRGLAEFLAKKQLFIWLENPLQIKNSSGIKRVKTDRFDSLVIAQYAYRYIDKAVVYKPQEKEITALQLLVSYRSRLVKSKVMLETSANEMRRVMQRDPTARFVYQSSMHEIERIKKQIQGIEKKMHETIMTYSLKENYLLMLSIKGIGMQIAVAMLIHTNNFLDFQTARQLASYCGCAPFPNESGTMDKGSRISRLANKELAAYFDRKIAQGKSKRLVINNVRNKLIQRIFAVVTNKIPYQENYLNPFEQAS